MFIPNRFHQLRLSVSLASLCSVEVEHQRFSPPSPVIAAAVRQPDQHGEGRKLGERRPQRHAEGERGPEGTSQGRLTEGTGQRGPSQGLFQR